MENIIEFLKGFNLQTIISLILIVWYFTNHIESKIQALDAKLEKQDAKLDRQSERTDKLYEMFINLLKEKR